MPLLSPLDRLFSSRKPQESFPLSETENNILKLESYTQLIEQLIALYTNFDDIDTIITEPSSVFFGYKPSTAYWDMKQDIATLKSSNKRKDKAQSNKIEIQQSLLLHKILAHDIIDHLYGGQMFSPISDMTDDDAENRFNDDEVSSSIYSYAKNQTYGTEVEMRNWLRIYIRNKGDLGNRFGDFLHLLDHKYGTLLSDIIDSLRSVSNSDIEDEIKKLFEQDKYKTILIETSQEYTRFQVFRGVLFHTRFAYIKAHLNTIYTGDTTKMEYLKNLEDETSLNIAQLNERYQSDKSAFDDYETYYHKYSTSLVKINPINPKHLQALRLILDQSVKKIVDDPNFETIIREKLHDLHKSN
jgi:hypothetical protein